VAHLGGIVADDLPDRRFVEPVPQTLPFLRMARKTRPCVIFAAASHSSTPALIGASSGMERTF
jgi:hypothetical protein